MLAWRHKSFQHCQQSIFCLVCINIAWASAQQKLRTWLGPSQFIEGTSPDGRMGAGFAAVDNMLFVFGGANSNGAD